jgi:DNA-binding NarL/FixJ family response regulator
MRALIVTDNPLSASMIRRALRSAAFPEVADRYVDASRPCAAAVVEIAPDIVIVDETRSPDNTLARIAEVRAALPEVKIVLLTSRMDAASLERATSAGVGAAIHTSPSALGLGALVREIAAGNVYHAFAPGPAPAPALAAPGPPAGLTSRELEILRLVAAGAANSVIGRQLWITEQTVKFHLSNVYRKLGVANRTQASRYAYQIGLLDPTTPDGIASTGPSVSVAA